MELMDVNYIQGNPGQRDTIFINDTVMTAIKFFREEKEDVPGVNGTEILHGIKSVRPGNGFVPNFPLTEKVDINGQDEHPLYTYLKKQCQYVDDRFFAFLMYKLKHVNDVRWNYEKFLIRKDGRPINRYSTYILPMEIEADIRATLGLRLLEEPNIFG